MSFLVILVGIGLVYFWYQQEKKKILFRVKIIDQLNGRVNYVTHVDGIQESFTYNSDPAGANLYNSIESANYVVRLFGGRGNARFVVERRVFSLFGARWVEVVMDQIG